MVIVTLGTGVAVGLGGGAVGPGLGVGVGVGLGAHDVSSMANTKSNATIVENHLRIFFLLLEEKVSKCF
jgi:hypothetical protein